MPFRQADGQIRSQFTDKMQFLKTVLVQPAAVLRNHAVMLLPFLDGIIVPGQIHGLEDRIPKLFNRLLLFQLREDFPGPGGIRNSHNGPLAAAGHRVVAERLHSLSPGCHHGIQLFRIQAFQHARNGGINMQKTAVPGLLVAALVLLPLGDVLQRLERRILQVIAFRPVIKPVQHDLASTGLIGLLLAHADKFRIGNRGGDDQHLPLLDMDAGPDGQPGVFAQQFLAGHSSAPFGNRQHRRADDTRLFEAGDCKRRILKRLVDQGLVLLDDRRQELVRRLGHAAANDIHIRIQHAADQGIHLRQVIDHVVIDLLRFRIAGQSQVNDFACVLEAAAVGRIRLALDGGAAGLILDGADIQIVDLLPVAVNDHVRNLAAEAVLAGDGLTVDDDRAADAGGKRRIEHDGQAFAGADSGFRQTGDIRIIVQICRHAELLGQGCAERQSRKARQIGGKHHLAVDRIHWSRHADSHAAGLVPVRKRADQGLQVLHDLVRSVLRI